MKTKIVYRIYSESKDGKEAEHTDYFWGKWSLIWWLVTNQFQKGVYTRRQQMEIRLSKHKY